MMTARMLDLTPVALTVETAIEMIFPTEIVPTSGDVLDLYERLVGPLGPLGYDGRLAQIHARSLREHPELARLLRSPECEADIEAAAMRFAHPAHDHESIGQAQARCGREAVARYRREIARQLAAVPGELQHAARIILDDYTASERAEVERLAAAESARVASEKAEAERLAQRRAAAERAAAEVAAAEQAAQSASAVAAASAENYRAARVRRLVAELEASGIDVLRVREGAMRGRYRQRDLIALLRSAGPAQIAAVEQALSNELERLESTP